MMIAGFGVEDETDMKIRSIRLVYKRIFVNRYRFFLKMIGKIHKKD